MTDLMTPGDDFAAIADDDAFLTALAAGSAVEGQEPTDALLASWRNELTAAAVVQATTPLLPAAIPGTGTGHRWYRGRAAASAAAVCVVLVTSTGVAAAVPGSPVHRALFGGASTTPHADVARITDLLDEVTAGIESANTAGGITESRRTVLGHKLDSAAGLLRLERAPVPALAERLSRLRAALAALPALGSTTLPDQDATDSDTDTGQHSGDAGSGEGSDLGDDLGEDDSAGASDTDARPGSTDGDRDGETDSSDRSGSSSSDSGDSSTESDSEVDGSGDATDDASSGESSGDDAESAVDDAGSDDGFADGNGERQPADD